MQKKIGENVSSKVGLTLKERRRRGLALNLSLIHFNAHFDSYDTIRVNSSVPLLPPSPGKSFALEVRGSTVRKRFINIINDFTLSLFQSIITFNVKSQGAYCNGRLCLFSFYF